MTGLPHHRHAPNGEMATYIRERLAARARAREPDLLDTPIRYSRIANDGPWYKRLWDWLNTPGAPAPED